MLRFVAAGALSLALAPAAIAQDATQQLPVVYVAYFKINYGDLDEWTRVHHEHTVPLLDQLVSEGVITGWNAWQHSTGGEYNWRLAMRANTWTDLNRFWQQYLSRLAQRAPDLMSHTGRMVQAHSDEVWNTTALNAPASAPAAQYFYDARFQVSFADLDEWNAAWDRHAKPVLDRAVTNGLLTGYVRQGHNTGGRYNWKIIYFFDAWDKMDEFFAELMGSMAANLEEFRRVGHMIQAHDDVIWVPVPN